MAIVSPQTSIYFAIYALAGYQISGLLRVFRTRKPYHILGGIRFWINGRASPASNKPITTYIAINANILNNSLLTIPLISIKDTFVNIHLRLMEFAPCLATIKEKLTLAHAKLVALGISGHFEL